MPNWKKLITSGSDASLNSLNVTETLTVETDTLYVSGSKVGIGTTNPQYTLQVEGIITGSRMVLPVGTNLWAT